MQGLIIVTSVWMMQFMYSNTHCTCVKEKSTCDTLNFRFNHFHFKAAVETNKSLLDVFNFCYREMSPFLMRISLAILHISHGPQKKVMRASLHIVPCGKKKKKKTPDNHKTGTKFSKEGNVLQFRFVNFTEHPIFLKQGNLCLLFKAPAVLLYT